MPLLKRLGEAKFAPDPGLETLLGKAFLAIQKKAIETAFRESEGQE